MINVNGTLFFHAQDAASSSELWRSNGTPVGTMLVKDFQPGANNTIFTDLANVNGTAYFGANDGTHGVTLWKSNGTLAGTIMLGGENPTKITNVNGTVFFASAGIDLWESNGTAAGTRLVKKINNATGFAVPDGLTNVNGTLFFDADDGIHGRELWRSNGAAAGTNLIKDIFPGSNGSIAFFSKPINANGTLFFAANNGVSGTELWRSNGTNPGTVLVRDINPGSNGSNPTFFVELTSHSNQASTPVPSDGRLFPATASSPAIQSNGTLPRSLNVGFERPDAAGNTAHIKTRPVHQSDLGQVLADQVFDGF
jgi:ELWxxDGT repeat protein